MTDHDRLVRVLPEFVARNWGETVHETAPLSGGMNSLTVALRVGDRRVVAKWVPAQGTQALRRGLATARLMEDGGVRAGAPVATTSGSLTVDMLGGALALLTLVEGEPLSRSEIDQRAWGSALAKVHSIGPRAATGGFLEWIPLALSGPELPTWMRRAGAAIWSEWQSVQASTWAVLHTDPEPEAFLRDAHGDVGVVDWAGSEPGPALYDLASAVMYAGGRAAAAPLLEAYRRAGVVPEVEIETQIDAFGRLRGLVQALYFSQRLQSDDLTGIDSRDDNDRGLADARQMLTNLGVDTAVGTGR